MRYKVFDHTADTGITAYGASADEIFENAAYGMFDLMTDVDRVRPVGEVQVKAEAHDLGSLMVDWLSELLFIHEVENVFFAEFDVAIEGFRLTAKPGARRWIRGGTVFRPRSRRSPTTCWRSTRRRDMPPSSSISSRPRLGDGDA